MSENLTAQYLTTGKLPRETDNAIQTLEYLIRRKRNTLNNASHRVRFRYTGLGLGKDKWTHR